MSVNIFSLSKVALVSAAIVVAGGAIEPQRAYGLQTGTLPVIHGPTNKNLVTKTKDNGSIPIIIVPNPSNVNGDGSGGGYGGNSYTVTISLNQPTSNDQPLVLSSTRPDLIQLPEGATVSAGTSTVTTTFTVPYSFSKHHREVHLTASCNNTTVDCVVHVHYHGEQD